MKAMLEVTDLHKCLSLTATLVGPKLVVFIAFIADIYPAPLQMGLLRSAPTPARPNNVVLSSVFNEGVEMGGMRRKNLCPPTAQQATYTIRDPSVQAESMADDRVFA